MPLIDITIARFRRNEMVVLVGSIFALYQNKYVGYKIVVNGVIRHDYSNKECKAKEEIGRCSECSLNEYKRYKGMAKQTGNWVRTTE